MTISDKGTQFIAAFEGFSSKPYLDAVGIPTIGYGTIKYPTGRKVTMNDAPISKEQALLYLKDHVEDEVSPWINRKLPNIPQHQFDAIASFIYNLGPGAIAGSTLLKRIESKSPCGEIKAAFLMWNKARVNGVLTVLKGLTRRREAEADLYCNNKYV